MTSIQPWCAVLLLAALASPAGADVRHPAPGAGADVSHQQATDKPEEEDELQDRKSVV